MVGLLKQNSRDDSRLFALQDGLEICLGETLRQSVCSRRSRGKHVSEGENHGERP